jgi:hypothetical protein
VVDAKREVVATHLDCGAVNAGRNCPKVQTGGPVARRGHPGGAGDLDGNIAASGVTPTCERLHAGRIQAVLSCSAPSRAEETHMILLWFWLIPVSWGGTDLALLYLGRRPAGSDLGAHPALASPCWRMRP